MRENISFSFGPIALLNNVEDKFNLLEILFMGLGGKAKTLKNSAKLFIYNKLAESISINRIQEVYPYELFEELGLNEISNRTLYRNLERIGDNYKFLMENYQRFIKMKGFVSIEQFVDFSSSYFEGNNSELGLLGYSRDNQPGKKQIVFGISTGINEIPTALTIQKGNICDKTHFKFMLKTVSKVLDEKSLLIFDCGANTKKNKAKIIESGFNYLTLKAKKRKSYSSYTIFFNAKENKDKKEILSINERIYECIKVKENDEIKYIFFSEKLKKEQVEKRERKFKKLLNSNDKILSKVKKGRIIKEYISREGNIFARGEIQKKFEIKNPFITGLEGYFILESSVDETSEKILRLYKDKDKAEKLIRDLKEGTDLRPIRHWSKKAIIGYLFIVFLTNCLIRLTHFLSNNIVVKNLKLLKKFLNNLTVTIIYRKNGLRERIFSNFCKEIRAIFGDKPPNFD